MPSPEEVRAVAQGTAFTSREGRRKPHTYRTGRTSAFTVKTTPETVDTLYAIAEGQGWKIGETFEKAVAALTEKLGA